MKNEPFTTAQYIAAIDRELGKRATTYPKILQKMMNTEGMDADEYISEVEKQRTQIRRLRNVRYLIAESDTAQASILSECLYELTREYKMRLSYYPRLRFH